MSRTDLYFMRLEIYNYSKKFILKEGWNDRIFDFIAKNSKFKIEEIKSLFPNGIKSFVVFYLDYYDKRMSIASKKINLSKLKTHEKIRKIILLRLNILNLEKNIIRSLFFYLLFPRNTKLALTCLYNTVDTMWFLAEDRSTDFNYYTKRLILAGVYSSTFFYWINNKTLIQTSKFLDKQLIKVSKIPLIKNNIKSKLNFTSKIFSFVKNY